MINLYSNEIEDRYIKTQKLAHRKKFAQFFTPYPVAQFMAEWIVNKEGKINRILDPSIGLGILIRALISQLKKQNYFIQGYELDPVILAETQRLIIPDLAGKTMQITPQDYLFSDWDKTYDGIICNPPYFKFQDYESKDQALQLFQEKLGYNLSGFTNLYTLFLLKSINQLSPYGRCAYLIPSEFMNADYGKLIKQYILKKQSLKYIIIFDAKLNLFADGLTTSSILLFANDAQSQGVSFITVKSQEELTHLGSKLKNDDHPKVTYTGLNPEIKWRIYYQISEAKKYKNLKNFSQYAKVTRGIATGANDYFMFDKVKAEALKIPADYFLPCVSKSQQVKGHFFTQKDFNNLSFQNHSIYLFNAFNRENTEVNKYIKLGENREINQKYLTRHRHPWYAIENRPPSPIWVGVFNRKGLRFVRNEAKVYNLTTFHCVYIHEQYQDQTELLFAYLLTDIAQQIFKDNRREYGGGLEKFEPNDLNNAKIIDLSIIDEQLEKQILEIYSEYRQRYLNKQENHLLIAQLNDLFTQLLV